MRLTLDALIVLDKACESCATKHRRGLLLAMRSSG